MDEKSLIVTIQIVFGALASFFAIMLWPRTRDLAWMFMIIGMLIQYLSLVFQALEVFGLFRFQVQENSLSLVIQALVLNAPTVFFALGFVVMVRRKNTL